MIVFDYEREYLADFAYIQAEREKQQEEEEWLWVVEQQKYDKSRKPAAIKVKFNEQLTISHDRVEIDS